VKAPSAAMRSGRGFFGPAWWLVRDVWRIERRAIIVATMQNIAGLAAALMALGGVLLTARALETGQPLSAAGLEVALTDTALVALISAALGLGILGAVMLYQVQWRVASIVTRHNESCIERLVRLAHERRDGSPAVAAASERITQLRLVLLRGNRMTAIVLRDLLSSGFPIVTLATALATLLIIDPLATACLIPLWLVHVALLTRVAADVGHTQSDFVEQSPQLNRELKQLFDGIGSEGDLDERLSAWRNLRDTRFTSVMGLFYGRRFAGSRARLLNTVFLYLCIAGLFLLHALDVTSASRSWTGFLAMIVALRFAGGGLNQLTSTVVRMSRSRSDYEPLVRLLRRGEADPTTAALLSVSAGSMEESELELDEE